MDEKSEKDEKCERKDKAETPPLVVMGLGSDLLAEGLRPGGKLMGVVDARVEKIDEIDDSDEKDEMKANDENKENESDENEEKVKKDDEKRNSTMMDKKENVFTQTKNLTYPKNTCTTNKKTQK